MKTRYKILIVTAITITSLLASDQYYLSFQDKELKKSDWVQNCLPVEDNQIVPSIGLYNHTHSFDLRTCTWYPTERGAPGFLESLYVSFVEPVFTDVTESLEVKHAYAACAATIIPQPCFDSFGGSTDPMTVRVRNAGESSFEFQYDEWEYLDGVHGTETVSYMVLEAGSHEEPLGVGDQGVSELPALEHTGLKADDAGAEQRQ